MRLTKRILSLLLALVLALALFGCDLSSLTQGLGGKDSSAGDGGDGFTPTEYTTVVKDSFDTTYADQLSPNEKAIYDIITTLPAGTTEAEVTLPELPKICVGRSPTDEEMDKLSADISSFTANALYAAWLDTPDLFWLDHTKYSYDISVESNDEGVVCLSALTLHLTLSASKETIDAQLAAIATALKDFAPTGKTAVERVAYINAFLVSRIEYDLDAPNRESIVGALVDGRCVCEGYARAFDYLASIASVDAVCIPGKAFTKEHPDGEGHMWNAVRIDGKLYAVDVTWNDTTKRDSYLLVGAKTVCDGDAFEKTHVPDKLTLDGPYKAFAFPKIEDRGYNENS